MVKTVESRKGKTTGVPTPDLQILSLSPMLGVDYLKIKSISLSLSFFFPQKRGGGEPQKSEVIHSQPADRRKSAVDK